MKTDIIFKKRSISKTRVLSGLSKYKGLMFSKKLKKEESVILKGKNLKIHMFFVFYPLDLVFLDSNKKVVDVKIGNPFDLFIKPKVSSNYVIEMNKGENILKIGDEVSF